MISIEAPLAPPALRYERASRPAAGTKVWAHPRLGRPTFGARAKRAGWELLGVVSPTRDSVITPDGELPLCRERFFHYRNIKGKKLRILVEDFLELRVLELLPVRRHPPVWQVVASTTNPSQVGGLLWAHRKRPSLMVVLHYRAITGRHCAALLEKRDLKPPACLPA